MDIDQAIQVIREATTFFRGTKQDWEAIDNAISIISQVAILSKAKTPAEDAPVAEVTAE